MAELTVTRRRRRAPTHSGALMREILDDHVRLPVAQAARRMQVSRQSLHAVLVGRSAVTADMALRFARLIGGAPELFLRMQANHDLWHARQKLAPVLTRIAPVLTRIAPAA
jgi:addiction module HigA family antidote